MNRKIKKNYFPHYEKPTIRKIVVFAIILLTFSCQMLKKDKDNVFNPPKKSLSENELVKKGFRMVEDFNTVGMIALEKILNDTLTIYHEISWDPDSPNAESRSECVYSHMYSHYLDESIIKSLVIRNGGTIVREFRTSIASASMSTFYFEKKGYPFIFRGMFFKDSVPLLIIDYCYYEREVEYH